MRLIRCVLVCRLRRRPARDLLAEEQRHLPRDGEDPLHETMLPTSSRRSDANHRPAKPFSAAVETIFPPSTTNSARTSMARPYMRDISRIVPKKSHAWRNVALLACVTAAPSVLDSIGDMGPCDL